MKLPTLDAERNRNHGPMWKTPIAPKVVRGLKQREHKSAEDLNKAKVRRRDKYCRFPLCGCRTFKLRLEVSHAQHKGAGGNPKGDRSTPDKMILLCAARHKENRVSVDRGTVLIKPLTKRGLAGPCSFHIDTLAMDGAHFGERWRTVARELAPHRLEPVTPANQAILEQLAKMTF
jgi:hypothetical protein